MRILAQKPRLALLGAGSLIFAGVSLAQPQPALPSAQAGTIGANEADFTVLTYNVKGLPWPVASGRPQALARIGDRLAWMRQRGTQPSIVVLQEAFTPDAKAIGDRAGYRYQVVGEDHVTPPAGTIDRNWMIGETQGKQIDSGLMILSDLPIEQVSRAAFPEDACAGYDCLAAKGVILVRVRVPGKGTVAIATTHLNSKGASMAPEVETTQAYGRQVAFLGSFLDTHWDRAEPLILAGDFNLGQRPERLALLPPVLAGLNGGGQPVDALRNLLRQGVVDGPKSGDARHVVERARDMHYVFQGSGAEYRAVAADIPFGSEADGEPLSDHFGYSIAFKRMGGAS
ncbi:endonuclease/exonuclease/phosphatase family protein [Croceicoccus bisphenolivorans]|uniref:endonuclease/exonuclease/phosphatase family protein n=1 Tax=Croceicoccus bisphenolivorans TaxID=1783232 RepID=UPI00083582D1|nr:endonuclease/exonuclease/phosphatase family protein [Croceicoccus bisphenolivorans]